jgi:hypothetical protein
VTAPNYQRPDYAGAQLKKPRVVKQVADAREVEAEKRRAYRQVDFRDGKRCRCCGRRGDPNATTTLGRIHRCHIHDAGTLGEMDAANLVSLCWICAGFETVKQLFFEGTDANDPDLTFGVLDVVVPEIFSENPLPPHVHIVLEAPRQRYGG